MNFTFTWILDRFGLQVKPKVDFPVAKNLYTPHEFDFPVKKTVAKKAAKVSKKVTVPKATTRKKK